MKKRLISLLLLVSTLLTLLPVIGVTAAAAEEALPKDETPGLLANGVSEGETLTKYDALYIGADGSKTANGGELVALYTAYGTDASVDLAAGKWADKMGGTAATLRGAGWTKGENGGVGYDFPIAQLNVSAGNYGLSLPEALLAPTLSVETVGMVKSFRNADGTIVNLSGANDVFYNNKTGCYASFARVDLLSSVFFVGIRTSNPSENFGARWHLSYQAFTQHWKGSFAIHDGAYYAAVSANGNKPVVVGAYYERVTDSDGNEAYGLSYATGESFSKTVTAAEKATLAAQKAGSAEKAGMLSFFNGVPSDVYAVRVYSAPLTEAERMHNTAVDILAYAGVDPAEYMAIDAATRAILNKMFCASGFNPDKEKVAKTVKELLAIFSKSFDVTETMYITDGITFFASAYTGLATGYQGDSIINWVNALDPTESASLRGGYTPNEKGGFTVVKSLEDYSASKEYGIYMPGSLLPREDYTVEVVFNPVGISVMGEDGTIERYVDNVTPTGQHHNMGIALGPFRALQFSCYRSGNDGQMERRWYYVPSGDISKLDWKYDFKDTAWQGLPIDAVENLSIAHDYKAGASTYYLYNNAELLQKYEIGADKYKTPDESENRFQLLLGMGGTVYSVRVYDRPLTRAEIAQNKVADFIYYYDLDATLVQSFAKNMGSDAGMLYQALSESNLSFSSTKEEAQRALEQSISVTWLSYLGTGVRKDEAKDAVRYYFDCNVDAAAAVENSGFTIEMGAIVNVNKNAVPTLASYNYDYKILAYDSLSGKNTPFFADDKFAVTVLYNNTDKTVGLANVFVRGYVKLTAADGTESTFYLDVGQGETAPNSLFNVYENMKDIPAVRADAPTYARLKTVIENCYDRTTVYVDAAAAAGGDGSKNAPFHSFAAGLAECKELLAKVGKPTRVFLMLADGEYGIYETQTITGADMPYIYSSFEITSENGKSTLTTKKNIDKSFTEYADNIWVCQLDKNENGEYPCFRYLYVDGEMADLAYSGGRYSSDDVHHVSAYERTFDAPWGKAYDQYKSGQLTEDSVCDYPAERTDLITAYEDAKMRFLALKEMYSQYNDGKLTLDSTCKPNTADYEAQYEAFKMRRLVLDDLMGQYSKLDGTAANNKAAFGTLEPTLYTDDAYEKAFITLRNTIKAMESINFEPYLPMVESNAIKENKYYVNEEVVGDLRTAIAEGKARNEAAYEAILAKYNAADAAGKAELEDELAHAAERVGEFTWFRYSLENCGPEVFQAGQWWHNIVHVAGVDYDDYVIDEKGNVHVAIYFEADEYANYFIHGTYSMVGRYVFMKNALAYVDSEGEYFYDENSGKVYYYSADGVEGKQFAHGSHDYMFVLEDARNVTFSDLHITGVDDAYLSHNDGCISLDNMGGTGETFDQNSNVGVFDRSAILLDDVNGVTVIGCTFDELGARAIFGRGILKNILIESNTFENIGAGAVHFGGGTYERTYVKGRSEFEDITITDNYVHDVAREYYSSVAIWVSFGRNLTVSHNTVEKCSYTAIGIGFTYGIPVFEGDGEAYHLTNVDVSYNYTEGFMHEIGDGGGIYLTGGSANKEYTDIMNYVHHNYVLMSNRTGNGLGHMIVGIYFDGSASNWKCYENVVTEQSYGAVASENEGFDLNDEEDKAYLKALRNRYGGSTFIYMQHIISQITHNNLLDGNYIINVRATDPAKQKTEVYKTYIAADRNIVEQNTRYITDVNRIPIGAEDIIYAAGSYGHTGDPTLLYNNDY